MLFQKGIPQLFGELKADPEADFEIDFLNRARVYADRAHNLVQLHLVGILFPKDRGHFLVCIFFMLLVGTGRSVEAALPAVQQKRADLLYRRA